MTRLLKRMRSLIEWPKKRRTSRLPTVMPRFEGIGDSRTVTNFKAHGTFMAQVEAPARRAIFLMKRV